MDRVTDRLSRAAVTAALCSGGADRDRTDDPLLAKQVLSQLSYGPVRREVADPEGTSNFGGVAETGQSRPEAAIQSRTGPGTPDSIAGFAEQIKRAAESGAPLAASARVTVRKVARDAYRVDRERRR